MGAEATAAAGWGPGGPSNSPQRPSSGCGRPAATVPGGVADSARVPEGSLGHGTTGDSILEGRKEEVTGPGSLTPGGHWQEPGQVFRWRPGLVLS